MHKAIWHDPEFWGYSVDRRHPLGTFQPLPAKTYKGKKIMPFELHLVGTVAEEGFAISNALKKVVKIHKDLKSKRFYQTLNSMVIAAPGSC